MLKLANLVADVPEVLLFVGQARTKLDDFFYRAGHALAEPKSPRVVFLGVVNGLQRLRTNALHIPEMEKLMRSNRIDGIERPAERLGVDVDGSGVSMLHAASRGPAREMV